MLSRREFLKLTALLPLLAVQKSDQWGRTVPAQPGKDQPNILIILFDALSARHITTYGYERNTSPNLARFADRATVFLNHYAAGNFTSPGTASLLTGTLPWTHRAFNTFGNVTKEFERRSIFNQLPAGMSSIAYTHNLLAYSLLKQFEDQRMKLKPPRDLSLIDPQYADRLFPHDYPVAFSSERVILRDDTAHPASFYLSFKYQDSLRERLREIKEQYAPLYPRGLPNLHDIYYLLEQATDWMISQVIQFPQPYLAYIHLLPPHQPYNPRREFIDIFKGDGFRPPSKPEHPTSAGIKDKQLRAVRIKYDEFLAFADHEFGRLYDNLERSRTLENTILVITSDHGEMFERGIRGHVTPTLYEPIARVPLMISRPGQIARQDVYTPTSCIDLLPTFLQILEQPIPDWCEGHLLPTFGQDRQQTDRGIYLVEAKTNPKHGPLQKGTIALVKHPYKLIRYMGYEDIPDGDELYDLANDPEELENMLNYQPRIASELQMELQMKLEEVNRSYQGE